MRLGLHAKPKGFSFEVKGKIVQSRFSTGWSQGGFKFQQLRNDRYDAVFCLGITPQKAYAWVIPKSAIFDQTGFLLKKPGLTTQHKGKRGSDTAWITIDLTALPAWMSACGGTVSEALDILAALVG